MHSGHIELPTFFFHICQYFLLLAGQICCLLWLNLDFINGFERCLCMQLGNVPSLQGETYDCTIKWSFKERKYNVLCNSLEKALVLQGLP